MHFSRFAQTTSLILTILAGSAMAAGQPWTALKPDQQEALAPLAQNWDALPEKQQKRLLATTRKFQELSPEKKQRYHKNLLQWINLTPDQRDRAREKYKAFNKVAPEKREAVKRMVLQTEAEKDLPFSSDYKDETASVTEASKESAKISE